ncbi:LLM class flavin-dependent oxidoreductase [Rhodococcoides corynebacterioides]|uniref:LLM family oxidoreductase n=1 Tax=Rhodococcoides corynebacterioides TaxID=53972 RepID=A0ABS2KQ63_9NOCA|nr:putative LLM family oxidoreductase [Rhodococcus corynebacterioides]MBP1116578.1 putative LLM family oxidoreductase [Rhodococcus sp. PvP016]
MSASFEIGITTFAETYPEEGVQEVRGHGRRLREVVEEAQLADEVGLDVYGVGEHHREDFAASAPAVVLAAIAARTERIRLTSAVSVLSSDDPVRVYQDFATLDQLSSGRAEVIAGRGSFTESFPLFGYELEDYDELFAEKLDLLVALSRSERVTWSGRHRSALTDQAVYPRALQEPLPVWVGVGGNPQSVVRAASYGLPVALAIIGGEPARFAPFGDLYRRALDEFGKPATPLAVHAHGFVGESDDSAAEVFFPPYRTAMSHIGRERGWPPIGRGQFDAARSERGSLVLGSPETVAAKIVSMSTLLGLDRFMLHISVGTLPHETVLRSIELLGREVAPLVRKAMASSTRHENVHS